MSFNVGDIIVHNSLGLMILVEKCPGDYLPRTIALHGIALFKMERLNSHKGSNKWILYDQGIEKYRVRLAADEDIIDALIHSLCTQKIGNQFETSFYPKDRAMSIYSVDSDNFIYLDIEAIKCLKRHLKEISI